MSSSSSSLMSNTSTSTSPKLVEDIRQTLLKEDCEFLQKNLLEGVLQVMKDVLRTMEDQRLASIMNTIRTVPLYKFKYPEKKPLPLKTAEDFFIDAYKQNEKQKDARSVRNEFAQAQKKWKEISEEEKKEFENKALEDKSRFDQENKEYQDQKKAVTLTQAESLRYLQDWHAYVNDFLHSVQPTLVGSILGVAMRLEGLTHCPLEIWQNSISNFSLPQRNNKRKREGLGQKGTEKSK